MYINYKPDFDNLLKTIQRKPTRGVIPCWELFADKEIMEHFLGRKLEQTSNLDYEMHVDSLIAYQLMMGYDFLPVSVGIPIHRDNFNASEDTADLTRGKRTWVDESRGNIATMEDFHAFNWPQPGHFDCTMLETAGKRLPEGMKIVVRTTGILENVQWLMGYSVMALTIYDCPELIDALFEKIGALLEAVYKKVSGMPGVGMTAMGDDMGFKGGTLFSPEFLKQYVMPWQKRCADASHAAGVPFVLHTCGQMKDIMDDLVDYVGIDAKHSFEDTIIPVEDVYAKYKGRVALIGGVDIDLLCRGSEAEVRARVRDILAKCNEGGYVMGTGNSVANYINPNNFAAMMDEVKLHNERVI